MSQKGNAKPLNSASVASFEQTGKKWKWNEQKNKWKRQTRNRMNICMTLKFCSESSETNDGSCLLFIDIAYQDWLDSVIPTFDDDALVMTSPIFFFFWIFKFSHGEKWDKFRAQVQHVMLQPSTARKYITPLNEIANDFMDR